MREGYEDMIGMTVNVGHLQTIQLIDVMGDDNRVVDAARISYGRHIRDRDPKADRHLLRFLMRHRQNLLHG